MRIIIDIPAEQEAEFIANYAEAKPVPLGEDGQPTMPIQDWIKENCLVNLNGTARRGALILYQRNFVPPSDVVRDDIIEVPR